MNQDSSTESKQHAPTDRKLEKLREEGVLAQSHELSAMISTIVSFAALLGSVPLALEGIYALFDSALGSLGLPLESATQSTATAFGRAVLWAVGPTVIAAVASSIAVKLVFNKGIQVSIKPVLPKLQRISIIGGLKMAFGKRGWVETGMSLFRLTIWAGIMALCFLYVVPKLLQAPLCGLTCTFSVIMQIFWPVVMAAALVLLAFALIDATLQRGLFLHEQRMTESELRRERKEQEGTPEMRRERRRRRREQLETAEHVGADKAHMLIFDGNRAVGIRYHRKDCPAPRVAAKAQGHEAVRVLTAKVTGNGFPAWRDPVVVESAMRTAVGSYVDEKIYPPLILGMQRHIGRLA